MNIFILASFSLLVLIVTMRLNKQKRQNRAQEESFWEREIRANSVRRKPLDGLNYITIPLEKFPTHLLNDNSSVLEYIETLESLTDQKIVNLTGWSNTDLKLEYGTANITDLSQFDQNYTIMVRTLQQWADTLIEAGYQEEAVPIMEFAVDTNTDVGQTYYKLAEYRAARGETSEIERLIKIADGLKSANRNAILRHLQEKLR